MRRRGAMVLALALLAAGCSSAEDATTTTSAPELTTTTTVPTTTTTSAPTTTLNPSTAIVEWEAEQFNVMLMEYNELFAAPIEAHIDDLDFNEAHLDCVVGQSHVEEWRALLLPAPAPVLDALAADLVRTLAGGFQLCIEAETIGEWNEAADQFAALNVIVERVYEQVDELT